MKLSIGFIALCLYILPAVSSVYVLGLFEREINSIAKLAIYTSIVSAALGYIVGRCIFKRNIIVVQKYKISLYKSFSIFLIVSGIISVSINFINVGSFPLFSGNLPRVELQKSILWNIMVFSSIGIFIYSSVCSTYPNEKSMIGNVLIASFLTLVLLTGWKGTFLNFIILGSIPFVKGKKIAIGYVLLLGIAFYLIFIGVNSLREGTASIEDIAFSNIIFYVYWGFYNFSDFMNYAHPDCVYSIPIFACKIIIDNTLLTDPTWNVWSALTPLYWDGGIYLIAAVFFAIPFVMTWSVRIKSTFLSDLLFYICVYFLMYAHNGYVFTSHTYSAMILLISLLSIHSRNVRSNLKNHGKYRQKYI